MPLVMVKWDRRGANYGLEDENDGSVISEPLLVCALCVCVRVLC